MNFDIMEQTYTRTRICELCGKTITYKEDLPNYYEISYARAIHLGAVKIEIKPL